MASEAMSESLQFAAVKRRAVASRSYRVRLPASNGLNFAPGGTVQFDLPANLAGTYVDMSQCYLKFKVVTPPPHSILIVLVLMVSFAVSKSPPLGHRLATLTAITYLPVR
jgi:hypothetical protein